MADCDVGLHATEMFGYRLAGSSIGASVAILRRTIVRAMPIMSRSISWLGSRTADRNVRAAGDVAADAADPSTGMASARRRRGINRPGDGCGCSAQTFRSDQCFRHGVPARVLVVGAAGDSDSR